MLNYEVFVEVPISDRAFVTEKVWINSEQGLENFLADCEARGWRTEVGESSDPTDSQSAVDRILSRLN